MSPSSPTAPAAFEQRSQAWSKVPTATSLLHCNDVESSREKEQFCGHCFGVATKQMKLSVALFIVHPDDRERFLLVKRPHDDDALPGVWGLPAVTCEVDELPEAAAVRVGREKLNAEIQPTKMIGYKFADRGDFNLFLIDIEAKLIAGLPDVLRAETLRTKYVEQMWTDDLMTLRDAAVRGSLCSQIVLDAHRIRYNRPPAADLLAR